MTDKIEEIRAALEGATQKRWRVGHDTEEGQPAMIITAGGFDIATCWGGYIAAENDIRLIALAPDMARIVLEQAEEIERLRKRVEAADRIPQKTQEALDAYRATEGQT